MQEKRNMHMPEDTLTNTGHVDSRNWMKKPEAQGKYLIYSLPHTSKMKQ